MQKYEQDCEPEECQSCPCLADCTSAQAAYVRMYVAESPQEWLNRIAGACAHHALTGE